MRQLVIAILSLALLMPMPSIARASIELLDGHGEYIMEDSESANQGQEIAFREAMRNIAQQAGVYIESSSRSSDSQLTNDEIELLTSALVKVKTKNFSKDVGKDDKLIVTVTVQAEIDTEQTNRMLNELMMAKKIEADYKKLKTEYADAIKNYDRLKN